MCEPEYHCEPEEICRIHQETNAEIRSILTELDARAAGDEELEALVIRLRETLGKRFLLNGIVDEQRREE